MTSSAAERAELGEFLKRSRERTLENWEQEIRRFPPARPLTADALRDGVPMLIDGVAEAVVRGAPMPEPGLVEKHVRTRLEQGFSIDQIAQEYRLLRSALLRSAQADPTLLLLDEAIDDAVGRTLRHYHQTRGRTLEALERLSQEALSLDGGSLVDLLRRLLHVVLDSVDAVDTAVIYLREWDRLVLRAAVGIETAPEGQFSVAMGEGIAGTVAAQRRPYFTPSAASDPLVSHALAHVGMKALYGVPLVAGDELVGVAKMGSRTASDFSPADRHLFEDMAQRAAVVITHKRLAEEREVFLGVLGHDLRSPLNTMLMGTNYLAKRENLSPTGARIVQRVDAAVRRMERMIGGLVDYTKARFGGGLTIDVHVMDLAESLGQILGDLRVQHEGREMRLDARGDLVGEWDGCRLAELVTNLANNALAYGDPARPVVVSADGTDAREVTLGVRNEGPVIPSWFMPYLFDPFRRGRTKNGGAGLGLYIVRHIAQAHGGAVTVQSTREGGTTFTVRLPRWSREPKR